MLRHDRADGGQKRPTGRSNAGGGTPVSGFRRIATLAHAAGDVTKTRPGHKCNRGATVPFDNRRKRRQSATEARPRRNKGSIEMQPGCNRPVRQPPEAPPKRNRSTDETQQELNRNTTGAQPPRPTAAERYSVTMAWR